MNIRLADARSLALGIERLSMWLRREAPAVVSSTTYTATGVSAQTCYIAQGVLPGNPPQTSPWSNVAGPTIGGATGKVSLSLTCTAGSGTTCTGVQWEFSAAPATAVTATAPAVPSMGAPTTSQMVKPEPTVASNVPTVKLKAAGL